MSVESTRRVIEQYWDSGHSDVSMMADDVTFTVMASGDEHKTPEGVLQMLHYFYGIAFEAEATPNNLIVADGHAVWEGTFHGKHIGEFAGIPATGKEVRVPLCVVYDVEDEQITGARIYFEMPVLIAQLDVSGGQGGRS